MSELNFPLSESLLPDWIEEQAQESGLRKLKKPLGQRRRLGIGTGVFTSSRVSNRKAQPGPRLQRILGVREEVWSRWLLRSTDALSKPHLHVVHHHLVGQVAAVLGFIHLFVQERLEGESEKEGAEIGGCDILKLPELAQREVVALWKFSFLSHWRPGVNH